MIYWLLCLKNGGLEEQNWSWYYMSSCITNEFFNIQYTVKTHDSESLGQEEMWRMIVLCTHSAVQKLTEAVNKLLRKPSSILHKDCMKYQAIVFILGLAHFHCGPGFGIVGLGYDVQEMFVYSMVSTRDHHVLWVLMLLLVNLWSGRQSRLP